MTRDIRTAQDADAIRREVEDLHDGFYADADRIDWHDFLDRLEREHDLDLGPDMDSPAVRRVRAIVREARAAS